MKQLVLYTAIAFTVGLFASGLSFAGSESYSGEKRSAVEEGHPGVTGTGMTGTEAFNPQIELNDEQIRELQSILQDEGYYAGEINGDLDMDSRSALEEFQRSEGLAVTGEPDVETLRSLAPSAEQQEFFGLSPEFGEGERMLEEKTLEPGSKEERIHQTPKAID